MLDLDIVSLLMRIVGSKNPARMIDHEDEVDTLDGIEYDFVVIMCGNRGVSDPVHVFWRLREKGILSDGCHLVFVDVRPFAPEWRDLEKIYGGVCFGTLFLMRYRARLKPGVVPSQRGMYMK